VKYNVRLLLHLLLFGLKTMTKRIIPLPFHYLCCRISYSINFPLHCMEILKRQWINIPSKICLITLSKTGSVDL